MSILDDVQKNRELFIAFNDAKYRRMQQTIGNSAVRRVINAIPVLLSVNTRRLPGYVDGDVPCGIAGFEPDPETLKYLRGRFYARDIAPRHDEPFIEMLAVMGSVGTIAYTRDSDFDFWVCVDRRGVPALKMENFQKKVEAIQHWAMEEADVEIHLFINDINAIKNNLFAESKEEAFGSVIGAVLKDEFFRSSIIIAGKTPFWWVLPRFVRDAEYETLYAALGQELRDRYFVDLGNLYEISKEDFIGAALFLIIKSLGNPFKSIIKLGLLEKYLFGPDYSPLLSQKVRSCILRGELDSTVLDSYLLMFEEVYDYYDSIEEDRSLLKILRHCMYLKINPQLSRYTGVKDRRSLPYRVLVMFRYVKEWEWNIGDIRDLDAFDVWDYRRTMEFWNMVKRFMLTSYQKIITRIPGMKFREKISESDFKLLSRKIRTHFSPEPNKIDHYITFKDTPSEPVIHLEPAPGSGIDDDRWSLLKKSRAADDSAPPVVVRTENGLVRLLAWCAINGIFNPDFSRVKFQSGYGRITQNAVIDLLARMERLFSGTTARLKNEYFLRPAFRTANMIIINFGIENADGIRSLCHLYQTSWGESYLEEFHAPGDLVRILESVVREGMIAEAAFDDYCVFISPEPFKKQYKDIEQMFRQAHEFIVTSGRRGTRRYVTRLGGAYISITRDDGGVSCAADGDIVRALTRLSLNPKDDIIYAVEGTDARLGILGEIFRIRKKNSITAVYEESGEHLILYLVNERDNMFIFFKRKQMKEEVLVVLYDFCQGVIGRVTRECSLRKINPGLALYQASLDRFGRLSLVNRSRWIEETYLVKSKLNRAPMARVAKHKSVETLYSISPPGGESAVFVPLKSVSDQVKKMAGSVTTGLIGGITFTDLRDDERELGSTPYLFEKYRLEMMIDRGSRISSRGNYPGKT